MVHMWSALLAGTKLGSKAGLEHWKMMVINHPFCSALLHWDSYSKPHVVLYRGPGLPNFRNSWTKPISKLKSEMDVGQAALEKKDSIICQYESTYRCGTG